MAIRTYDILLDSYNSTIPEPIVGRQGDKNGAVTLHVTITDRGTAVDLTGKTINLMAETAKGTAVVADNVGVTLTDSTKGKFDYAIPNALWSEAGKITKAYFSLNDTDGQQTTYDLIFIVKKAIDIAQDKADDYIAVIDGTIRDLKTKIDAIYADFSAGNFYSKDQIDTLVIEKLNQTVSVNTDYFSNYEVIDYFKPEIDRVAPKIDTSKFNLLVNTDAHFSDNSGLLRPILYDGAGKLSSNHFSNTIALSKGVDAIIAGGDQVDGNDSLPASTAKDNSLIARKLMNNILEADVFMILGNHDTADQNLTALTNQKLDVVVRESQIKEAYQTKSIRFGEARDGDSLYFYKDYPDKKVRLIGINTSDIGELTTDEGYAKYSRLGTCVIGQQQMNWIANTALMTTPAGYHVVMYGHIPLGADNWSGTLQEAGYTNQNANCGTLGDIIDAFKSGTSIHATNNVSTDYPIDVTADFTQRGVGNFVAYFCGHVHHEEIVDFHSFKKVLLLNSLAWTAYNSVPGTTRELGSAKEDAQTVISIDTNLRRVDLIGFGSATDRTITY